MAYGEFNIETATYIGSANSGTDTKTFTIDDLSGNYSIYSVWVNSCGTIAGEISNALDITVVDGVIQTIPTHNPLNIRIENLSAGEFKIRWDYKNLLATDIKPTKFYIYDDINPSQIIGTTTYNTTFTRFSFTTTESYSHDQEVTFTVKAVNGTFIREDGISIIGTADSEGPNITIDSESIELI